MREPSEQQKLARKVSERIVRILRYRPSIPTDQQLVERGVVIPGHPYPKAQAPPELPESSFPVGFAGRHPKHFPPEPDDG